MRKIDYSPTFDGIAETVARNRREKTRVTVLFGAILVFNIIAGIIFGANAKDIGFISLCLFFISIVVGITALSLDRITKQTAITLEYEYVKKAQELLSKVFELELSSEQIQQLGFHKDWRKINPGVAIGSTATLSDFPKSESRYHSIIAVKFDENSIRLFETEGQTVITQL